MFERRFGVRAYDYRWGYTKAQIELLAADQPLVLYKKDKAKSVTKSEADDLADKWAQKHKKRESGEKILLSDIFSGDNVTKIDNPLKL